jgi:hypothetical protein
MVKLMVKGCWLNGRQPIHHGRSWNAVPGGKASAGSLTTKPDSPQNTPARMKLMDLAITLEVLVEILVAYFTKPSAIGSSWCRGAENANLQIHYRINKQTNKNSVAFSPQANYTD